MVEEYLSQKGIGFQERDVSSNRSYAQELARTTGQMGVPVTIIDGQTVIGFDRNRLEQILALRPTGQRPSFGAFIADAGKITIKQGKALIPGAYVGSVKPNSTAERTGLLSGDIITEFNTVHVTDAADLERVLSALKRGSHFSLSFLRDNTMQHTEGIY
jgi:S1-C subfamily serine protease